MNKEVIKRYKPEFDWWVAGGELLDYFTEDNEPEWVMADDKLNDFFDSEKYMYVINDKYVEFRKALAEGKYLEVFNDNYYAQLQSSTWVNMDTFHLNTKIPIHHIRIKPDEPKFKVGDYVTTKNGVLVFQIEDVFGTRVSYRIGCKEDYQFQSDCKLWALEDASDDEWVHMWTDEKLSEQQGIPYHLGYTTVQVKSLYMYPPSSYDHIVPAIGQTPAQLGLEK